MSSTFQDLPGVMGLMLRVHILQAWRRLVGLRHQSRLLSFMVLFFVVGYVVLSFWLFRKGLGFVSNFPGLGGLLVERLLFLLFACLFVLLLFSNLIISYTNLFRNPETQFLITLPLSSQSIFRWKFLESTILASWAFVFLIAPLLAAYGLNEDVRWDFYLVTPFAVALFVLLPAVLGAWSAIQIARYLDRKKFQLGALLTAVALIAGSVAWFQPEMITDRMLETRVLAVLDRLLSKTDFAQFPFLPSYWLSSGVVYWTEGAWFTALFFLLVLLSYVLFFGFFAYVHLGRPFYEAYSEVHSRESALGRWQWHRNRRRRKKEFGYHKGPVEQLAGLLFWLQPDTRALVIKDVRMFWRDTAQWGQTIVLFGLLAVYIMNLRHFSQQLNNPFWINLVAYLNLGACSLNLATLTTRFVYPQFSLEGKRLWIVGMAPLGLQKVVLCKFWLAVFASLAVTLGLIWMSCHMLKLPLERFFFFAGAITLMTFTLNGLAVGLGVLYPNFKEDNPSKIVSGFGGTLCLVLSFLFIVLAIVLLALGSPWTKDMEINESRVLNCWILFSLLSLFLGYLPLKWALRRLHAFEL